MDNKMRAPVKKVKKPIQADKCFNYTYNVGPKQVNFVSQNIFKTPEVTEKKSNVLDEHQYTSSISVSADAIPESCDALAEFENWPDLSLSPEWPYNIPPTQKCADHIPLSQKCTEDKEHVEISAKATRDVGTMTDHSIIIRNLDVESQCNELFGRIVACEISNLDGKARYEKMKGILDIFQKLQF